MNARPATQTKPTALASVPYRPLWNPFRRSRGYARPIRPARTLWFWPVTDAVQRRRHQWARRRANLQTLEVKSSQSTSSLPSENAWRWPNFTPSEMACRHCGQGFAWPAFMDALQGARDQMGRPFRILSAHRCGLHNARVGGAPRSQHLRLAVDIALEGHNPHRLYEALKQSGFTGFGFYTTFIHADMGAPRAWYGSHIARQKWQT